MDDIKRVRHPHTVRMEDRKKAQFTGITDVISFEPSKVILESDYGVIVIKGESLHVNKLSVEKAVRLLRFSVASLSRWNSVSTLPSAS